MRDVYVEKKKRKHKRKRDQSSKGGEGIANGVIYGFSSPPLVVKCDGIKRNW